MNNFLKKLYYSRVFWVGFGLAVGIGTTFIQQLYVFKVELQLRFFLLPAIAGGVVGVILQHAVWLQKRFREQLHLINVQEGQLKE